MFFCWGKGQFFHDSHLKQKSQESCLYIKMDKLIRLDRSKIPKRCLAKGKCPPVVEYGTPSKYCLYCLSSVLSSSSSDWSKYEEALELLISKMRARNIEIIFNERSTDDTNYLQKTEWNQKLVSLTLVLFLLYRPIRSVFRSD